MALALITASSEALATDYYFCLLLPNFVPFNSTTLVTTDYGVEQFSGLQGP